MINETERQISFPVMKITQPIGGFYIGKMKAKDLIDISWFDIRKLSGDSDLDHYLGIQRKLNTERVSEIAQYVTLSDATFPTAVVLAVEGKCVEMNPIQDVQDSIFSIMNLRNMPGDLDDPNTVLYRGIARVLDGQHRIMGLKETLGNIDEFEVNVCIFVDIDMADQASIFATVNLAQTKVNHSLVYDLQSYSESRSPEKTCHAITVTLDQKEKSPFYRRIKRLGVATDGRFAETLTQATVVKELLPLISNNILRDRDIGKRIGKWSLSGAFDKNRLIFRQWFIEERDDEIALQMMNYFEAVRRRWPNAWASSEKGNMLPRTNGFKAFMTVLRPAHNALQNQGEVVKMSSFLELFSRVKLGDEDFSTENFPPGGSGDSKLARVLMEQSGLSGYN